ncbi:MAG: ABC transporter substrate-binding protein [Deltaproteobacteria bacterium]|nr:ABC transporter substrate-binding protein [Deltaproteobacteria bacterium]
MGRVRIAVARLVLAGFLPVFLLASAVDRPVFAADRLPLALKDDRGVTVRLSAPPRRIVSLAPSLTEIVFLLGREGFLVGVTRFCNVPAAASGLPKIGGVSDPDVERIVALSPDLVLCTTDGNPRDKVRALEEMGIPCFAVAPQDLGAVFTAIERVGFLLGAADRGRAEAEALRLRARLARPPSDDAEKPAVLFVVSTEPIIAAGEGTFMDELVRLAGGRNVAARFSGRYPRLSVEGLVAARPAVIFVAGMSGVERFPSEVIRWKEVPAFRDGAVITLDGDLVTRPGPRLVTALERVSAALAQWRASRPKVPAGGTGGER